MAVSEVNLYCCQERRFTSTFVHWKQQLPFTRSICGWMGDGYWKITCQTVGDWVLWTKFVSVANEPDDQILRSCVFYFLGNNQNVYSPLPKSNRRSAKLCGTSCHCWLGISALKCGCSPYPSWNCNAWDVILKLHVVMELGNSDGRALTHSRPAGCGWSRRS